MSRSLVSPFHANGRKDIFRHRVVYDGTIAVTECTAEAAATSSENSDLLWLRNKTNGGTVLVVEEKDKTARFEQTILPHLDAAYNLARWLTRNEQDAQDMVQEAYLRAFRFFHAFQGAHEITTMFDEEIHSVDSDSSNPAALVLRSADHQLLREALDELPVEFREVVVLRDLEGFSYKEIAGIANIPAGTVMSRLARARERLKQLVCNRLKETP